jgi:hypothetical protein
MTPTAIVFATSESTTKSITFLSDQSDERS